MPTNPVMQSRRKRKAVDAAAKLLPGERVHDYAAGRASTRWTSGTTFLLVAFAVVFVGAAAMGYVVYPGGLFLVYLVNSVRPPRGVAVVDGGVAVLSVRAFNGLPAGVVSRAANHAVAPSADGKGLVIAGEQITLRRQDRGVLRLLIPALAPVYQPAQPVTSGPAEGWYDDPLGEGDLRWWDGVDWTAHVAAAPTGAWEG